MPTTPADMLGRRFLGVSCNPGLEGGEDESDNDVIVADAFGEEG